MTDSQEKQRASYGDLARIVGANLDADMWLYSGPLARPHQKSVMHECSRNKKRPNALLMLATYGGSPHVAYRIGRCLQDNYKKVVVCVAGPCMSAGTLLALAAHELVISDRGTLGPLDIQLPKEDDLWQRTSGLAVKEAVSELVVEASAAFDMTLVNLTAKSGGRITLRTATETASSLTAQLFQPLFGQIDPLRLAEDDRSMRMVGQYGKRLADASGNLQDNGLSELLVGYPSHAFEIDRTEAAERLFLRIREPDQTELALFKALEAFLDEPSSEPLLLRPTEFRLQNEEDQDERQRCNPEASNRGDAQDQEADRSSVSGDQAIGSVLPADPAGPETDKVH